MRPLWLDLRSVPVHKRIGYLRAAREASVEAVLVGEETIQGFELPIVVASPDGSLARDGAIVGHVHTVADAKSAKAAGAADGIVLVTTPGWHVIPLETLVAARRDRPNTLYAFAANPREAALCANVLQTGVHGVVLTAEKPGDILETRKILDQAEAAANQRAAPAPPTTPAAAPGQGRLETAVVAVVTDGGMAERVCLDMTERFAPGQGLALGATAASLALVAAETAENEHIAPRPFRVNAGAIHHYALAEDGKTAYLSELASGARLVALDRAGTPTALTVGRCKVERRPHTLLRWTSPAGPGHAFFQTAETVRLVAPDGTARPVTALKAGDAILVWTQPGARHTGMPVDGEVVER
jgi:3-dehydroquinate synthase II